MSIEATSWALNVPVGGTAKVVLLGLASHAHADGSNAFPAVETLTRYAHCDRRTVQRNLRKLAEDGWIVDVGVTENGVTKWQMRMDRVGGGNMPPVTSEAQGGGTGAAGGAALVPPEPSMNRQGEPSTDEPRASAADRIPDDFPDDLRPHARSVMRVLREMAEHHGAKEVTARAVALVVMANRQKPLVAEAYALASWAADSGHDIRDVVGRYRTWLKRADTLAGVERLDEQGLPCVPGPRGVVGGRGRRPDAMDQARQNQAEIDRLRAAGEIE